MRPCKRAHAGDAGRDLARRAHGRPEARREHACGLRACRRGKKGQLNYGSVGNGNGNGNGNGSASHLAMEHLKACAGLEIVHLPYRGFLQAVNAILAGQVQAGFMVPGIAIGNIRAGKLKALGVTTLGRSGWLPELPSFVEQGCSDFEAISWQAVPAPAGTLQVSVDRVASASIRIIESDDVRGKMLGRFFSAADSAPQALVL